MTTTLIQSVFDRFSNDVNEKNKNDEIDEAKTMNGKPKTIARKSFECSLNARAIISADENC